jgi:hypothetical protein
MLSAVTLANCSRRNSLEFIIESVNFNKLTAMLASMFYLFYGREHSALVPVHSIKLFLPALPTHVI